MNRAEIGQYKKKQKHNSLSGLKLMSRDRLSHIYYEMHMLMFPQVVTSDCKQYLQQLMIQNLKWEFIMKGVAASGRTLIFDVSQD